MARSQLGQYQPGFPSAPTVPPPPDYSAEQPPPGYTGQRSPGSRRSSGGGDSGGGSESFEDAVAGVVMEATAKFIGRAIGRRVKRAYNERVLPTMAARQEAVLREQIAIAERHPDLRTCLNDQVIFLADGSRVLPMASLTRGFTLEQADEIVARLREG